MRRLAQQEASPISVQSIIELCAASLSLGVLLQHALRYVTVLNNDNLSPLGDLAFQCHGRPSQKVPRNDLVFSITIISSLDIDAATELPTEYVLLCLKKPPNF